MPTPDRLPQPPGPPTLASILADHEREKRRQQRPATSNPGRSEQIVEAPGAVVFQAAREVVYTGGSFVSADWTPIYNCVVVGSGVAPTERGYWLVDARYSVAGTVGDIFTLSIGATGPFHNYTQLQVLSVPSETPGSSSGLAAMGGTSPLYNGIQFEVPGGGTVGDFTVNVTVYGLLLHEVPA